MATQNLANKYRPKTWGDMTEQHTVVDMIKKLCEDEKLRARNFLLIGSAGVGKACTMDTKILTPTGFVEMRDVKVGQLVFTHTGAVAEVSGVFPQGEKEIYRITLSDKTFIDVSEDHINCVTMVRTATRECEDLKLTTEHLISVRTINNALAGVSGSADVIIGMRCPKVDFEYRQVDEEPDKLGKSIAENPEDYLNIPEEYMLNSFDIRMKLYRSIVGDTNSVTFSCESLSNDFAFVVRSLGISDVVSYDESAGIYMHNLASQWHIDDGEIREIESIEKIGEFECQCLYVDHCEHTFICNDGLIPTHNTTIARIIGGTLNESDGNFTELDAASNNGVDTVRELVSQAQSYPVGTKYKIFLIDECFPAMTYIKTLARDKLICQIEPGDVVRNLTGLARVKAVHKNKVGKDRLMCVKFKNHSIVTTLDHLFFTDDGWVKAKELRVGDKLYDSHIVRCAWEHKEMDSYTWEFKSTTQLTMRGNDIIDVRSVPELHRNGTDRGGWAAPNLEPELVVRANTEGDIFAKQVQSIEFYQPGENDDLFIPCFGSSDALKKDYVYMYDLEVEGHPSYFANDVLVHNCHAFSQAAWQCLLKVLEEGPAKSVFILATTNPEKIPATILSRVQVFQLSKISLDGIVNRLKHIIEKENEEGRGITYTDEAIQYIGKMANGGMRDAITTLDKALAYSIDLTIESVTKALGLPSYDEFFDLLSAYAKKDNQRIAQVINTVYNSGVNFIKWFENFHSFVIQILKYVYLQDINATTIPSFYTQKISKYGVKHANMCLKLANVLVKMNSELKSTQYLQELALTYLCYVNKEA